MDRDDLAPAANNQPVHTQAALDAAVSTARTEAASAAVTAERDRVTALAELDAESTFSDGLTAAITGGTSAGDFATQLVKAGREQQASALEGARKDAAKPDTLPEGRTDAAAAPGKVNRGEQAVEKLRGKHRGLPAKA